MTEVRLADYRDEDQLLGLVLSMQRIGPIARMFPPRNEKILQQIEVGTRPDPATRTVSSDKRCGLIGVVGDPGQRLAASIGLFLIPEWFTDVPSFSALWTFVRPEERHRNLDKALFEFAVWAKTEMRQRMADYAAEHNEAKMPLFMWLTYVADGRLDARDRLWGRYAKRVGSIFLSE